MKTAHLLPESQHRYLDTYVVQDWCQEPSHFCSEGDLDTFFITKSKTQILIIF